MLPAMPHRTLILCELLYAFLAHVEADIWVSVENRIDSISSSANYSVVVPEAKHIIGLSNPVFHHGKFSSIFATELGIRGPSIYKIGKSATALLTSTKDSMGDDMPSYFEDIVYDPPTAQLFMTSKNPGAIFKMSAESGKTPTKFLSTSNKKPTGISVDTCSRNIFWTNSNRKNPTIEVMEPDTGNSWTLVSTNLTRPRAISVDTPARKVYWTDTSRGVFWISRISLDGTGREVVCKAKDHDPFSLVVTEEFIYWSDWTSHALWRTSKHGDCVFQLVQKFATSKPHGVTIIPPTENNCDDYKDILEEQPVRKTTTESPPEQPTTIVSTYEEPANTTATCDDYCLGGECVMTNGGPACDCYDGYAGARCHLDMCYQYCLEGGECVIIEDQPECVCKDGFEGDRCQVEILPGTIRTEEHLENTPDTSYLMTLVYILGSTTGGLTIIVAVMSFVIHKMRLRPRVVRKRFISVAGPGKKNLESRSGSSSCGLPVEDGVQLDIENCCNMTLCDTPCFEPPTRGPKKSNKPKSSPRAQDKQSLLANDDEDF